ncbi:uncharacterized protein FOMMEDRAFT_131122 [Fomitiporia mediterranea MF3/22]|uniref:uncharacterized protein n=1 Tax=Fomitiporia mediterranea (strain MF3/22) TaxID=694068 RepID=UPI0004409460|nr:uncharacterized protein FOMMEDRAFT_131122 [Fomitiporia mediterranea MF3/22]EJD08231.1 hypothetical protein FOMMEDRAFT_131122 [Fomitiporia mediterranea MF3/22]
MAPRAQTAGQSLRNRNRISNKTRLKVIRGNIDADPLAVDEDDDKARLASTAGVDAEDANEHHLQAVLSAASHRATSVVPRASTSANGENNVRNSDRAPTAFIPVPDAAGVVENVDELYPPGRWVEYATYIKFSDAVDESLLCGLNDGFTYIMDERDAEWLEKNNQEARGEGTSSQASASSTSGATTRSGHRSTKGKGKEAEANIPVPMNENDFELVMGLFEKITHDNTPFLHVTFQQQQDSCISSFSDYQDVFANDLPKNYFARFMTPPNIPPPSMLVRMAKTVYPHWKQRKIEREGQRIIPGLNFDESDTKNESYICFRRRDQKSIRKTRQAAISSADKLSRLKKEIGQAIELSTSLLHREGIKKESVIEAAKDVWERRIAFLELKRKSFSFAGKEDEEVLIDKERQPKKSKAEQAQTIRLKSRPNGDISASPTPAERQMRPKDRFAAIQQTFETAMKRIKEGEHGWDDQIDSSFQQSPIPLPDKYFKVVPESSTASASATSDDVRRAPVHTRMRVGRGGRLFIDRRRLQLHGDGGRSSLRSRDTETRRSTNLDPTETRERLLEEDERARRIERWRYDLASEPTGADEENRGLFDDYDARHMRVQAMLLNDADPLMTDNRLLVFDPSTGTHNYVNPVKPVPITSLVRRDAVMLQQVRTASGAQPPAPQSTQPQAVPVAQTSSIPNPLQSPIKIPASSSPSHARATSNGAQRSPSSASATSAQVSANPSSSPPSNQANAMHINGLPPQSSPVNGMPSVPLASTNGVGNGNVNGNLNGLMNGLNGVVPGLQANTGVNAAVFSQQQAIAMQKQNLQKFYANYSGNMQRNSQSQFPQHSMLNGALGGENVNIANAVNGVNNTNVMGPVNMNLKLPANRQIQWTNAAQRVQSGQGNMMNGNDAAALQNLQMQQLASLGLLQSQNIPAINGHSNSHLSPPRSAHSPPNALGHGLSLSPHMGSPAQSQVHMSPSRNMQTPVPPSPSPLLQHQVPNLVGGLPSQNQGF